MKKHMRTIFMVGGLLFSQAVAVYALTDQLFDGLGAEKFFDTPNPSGLIARLKDSDKDREDILPVLYGHCFVDRSMSFPNGIIRLREVVLEEAKLSGNSLFRIVADTGSDMLRLNTLEWMATQPELTNNESVRNWADVMIEHLAVDMDPNILIRATQASLSLPPPYGDRATLFINTVMRTLEYVKGLSSENKLVEIRSILDKLERVIDEKKFRAALSEEDYERIANEALDVLWPLTSQDIILYERTSWALRKFNTRTINEKFYSRATDEAQLNPPNMYTTLDGQAVFFNHPDYFRSRVREDCEKLLNECTYSFENPPAQKEPGSCGRRSEFLLRLAASYGDHDLVDRAARHVNKWYHEIASKAFRDFPRRGDGGMPDLPLAKTTLRSLSDAAEKFAFFNNGSYPKNIQDLTQPSRPYLSNDCCGKEIEGFSYICEFSSGGYAFTATSTGGDPARKISVTTGGVLREE